jgi:hypothetical protein
MTPAEIKSSLQRRGVQLNGGLKTSKILQQSKVENIVIDPYIIDIFTQFNGFQDGASDPGSCVRVWSFEEAIAERNGQKRSTFADFLLQSNRYTWHLENARAPIFLDDDEVAENLEEFFTKLVLGHFDF